MRFRKIDWSWRDPVIAAELRRGTPKAQIAKQIKVSRQALHVHLQALERAKRRAVKSSAVEMGAGRGLRSRDPNRAYVVADRWSAT